MKNSEKTVLIVNMYDSLKLLKSLQIYPKVFIFSLF